MGNINRTGLHTLIVLDFGSPIYDVFGHWAMSRRKAVVTSEP